MQVKRDEAAIEWALFRAGWRIYLTNAPQASPLTEAVLAYRDQYIEGEHFPPSQRQDALHHPGLCPAG
ncbi:MAG: hypothetical protein IPM39_03435 [Chloroflexi bacterium]|nr:hypothetical protein [Chloroflexota bacterium]